VDYELEVEDDADVASELTKANIDLVTGKENITLLNETVSATSVQINDTIGNIDYNTTSFKYILCLSLRKLFKSRKFSEIYGMPNWN
jgi:hypothetical protein